MVYQRHEKHWVLDRVVVLGAHLIELLEEINGPVGRVLLRFVQSQEVIGWDYVVMI